MKPLRTLAEARTPDGSRLTLHEHDGDIFLKLNGRQVMSSAATASEVQLAEIACDFSFSPRQANPRLLVGGLGLGFTLRRVLDLVGPHATVHVAECIPEVIAWNRELLAPENRAMLKDPRVSVMAADVFNLIKKSTRDVDRYDAILLDVDNGPVAMVATGNQRLYSRRGLATIARALHPGGRLAIWSADDDRPFLERLEREGFRVKSFEARAHERAKRAAHRIYLAENGDLASSDSRRKTLPSSAEKKDSRAGNAPIDRVTKPRRLKPVF
jgi:spermidine synthase